ncbi:MAG: hypothetical protein AAFU64_17170, partial [Bacteroidota bacterium]
MIFFIFALGMAKVPILVAQEENQRCRWFPAQKESFLLDSLSIIPASIRVQSPDGRSLEADFDFNSKKLSLREPILVD